MRTYIPFFQYFFFLCSLTLNVGFHAYIHHLYNSTSVLKKGDVPTPESLYFTLVNIGKTFIKKGVYFTHVFKKGLLGSAFLRGRRALIIY